MKIRVLLSIVAPKNFELEMGSKRYLFCLQNSLARAACSNKMKRIRKKQISGIPTRQNCSSVNHGIGSGRMALRLPNITLANSAMR
ncbi:hypothetical protein RyT2_19850 [Pseudolactococcus yaeyamensis]